MKKYLSIFLAFAAAVLLFSCTKESDNPYEQVPTLSVKKIDSQMEYGPEATTGVIVIDTEESISATSDKAWCTATVNGKTINLSLEANYGKINRYAQITVKSATASVVVSILQYGEILAGLSSLSDVTATVDGDVITIPVKLNVTVDFFTEADWVHPVVEEDEMVITIDSNPNPSTRFAVVGYTAGSYEGSFEVVQYPELKVAEDWEVKYNKTSFKYPKFSAEASVKTADTDMYVSYVVPKSVVGEDIEDYVFSTLAVSARREILGRIETEGGEFSDYLNKGSKDDINIEDVKVGDNYVIAVGFGENGYVTGLYQYASVTIEDIRSDYYKWAGQWQMTGTYFDGSAYSEIITISVDESDVKGDGSLKEARLIVSGLNSKAAEAWSAPEEANWFYVKYNSGTGAIAFYGQNASTPFNRSSGDGWKLQLMSMYVKAGATSYTSATGYDILLATMDGTTGANVYVLERSAGLSWRVLRLRCLNASGSAYTNTNANNASIMLDSSLTMKRVN